MYNDFESLVLMSIILICGAIVCFIGHFVEEDTTVKRSVNTKPFTMTERAREIELFEQFR